MFSRFVAAVAACVLAVPAAAAAQGDASPAPRQAYVVVDYAAATAVGNELAGSTGNGSSYGIRAVAELPLQGHNYLATFDYTSYSYNHPSNNAFPAGIVAGCPANDPGCVTPIGAQYYATVKPGIALYVPSFSAQDNETHFAIGTKIARDKTRLYLGLGALWRSFNYTSQPSQSGFGIGLEKLPDLDRELSLYGNFWVYTDIHGSFTGPASATLGAFSAYPMTVDYHMYTYRVGATWAMPNSPLFLDLGIRGDRADARNANVPADAVHAAVSLGVGAHF